MSDIWNQQEQLTPTIKRIINVPALTATTNSETNLMMILPSYLVHKLEISIATWPMPRGEVETSLQVTPVTDTLYAYPYTPVDMDNDQTTNMTDPTRYHMNVLVWNCRGAGNTNFRCSLRDVISNNHPDIVVLTETRLSGDRAAQTASMFPFDGFFCTETRGLFSGIWIMWRTDRVHLHITGSTEQEVHATAQVTHPNSPPWLLTAIYASPRPREREILWQNLRNVADTGVNIHFYA
ncbi:hypothetical protein CRG98_031747 [Punica granatum]|uniref:Endonuclease/exonuclease/phosphatase domain-containing protein n=1 Tax=Punica granatum TaxID=22663 RepID=A0A2I0IVT8_PUNGR|nr:hypothetical protein CRG98_031747 [Punica granatum]